MYLRNKRSGIWYQAEIVSLKADLFKLIFSDKRFEFDWGKEKRYEVFQIKLKESDTILGLISIEDIPNELRLFIRLIEVSKENQGINKEFEYIAGCLIAYACRLSFEKDYEGFVSLIPKTELIDHYQKVYGFDGRGRQMYLEGKKAEILIEKYLSNEI